MPMEATKTTSFIAGALMALSEAVIKFYSLPEGVFSLVIFFLIIFLVLGKQITREFERQIHGRHKLDENPWKDTESWRFNFSLIARLLLFCLGFISAAELINLANGI
ncbi:hypothetical protein ALT761_02406 [Alteromonas sp. 76-1]|jgi:hypothetical protein|uniref:hypothetical protein n=2 Tax=Alteromonas TaxID=226 RepID=UPI000FD16BAA|nr:hypothetical protein [Alteromonas sp. 76-1]VEL97402.1 hypothetical protein ALT761_02406 [Alteromonas sp. 76-1]